MSEPFQTLHHICLVVHDLDRAADYYQSIGLGPWHDFPPFSDFSRLDMPNLEGFLGLKYKFANLQNMQLQLCQPGSGDTPQKRFLDRHGEGVFHIGFSVADSNRAEAEATAMGLNVLMRGRRPDGSGFTYFDTAEKAGGVTLMARSLPFAQM
ncbi:MAG: VOC family protein [Acetobacter sp.]|uniref:VOC family protein n=1 Tax=Acetobacter sp. TaxID=440 RepID=UPI0039EC6613